MGFSPPNAYPGRLSRRGVGRVGVGGALMLVDHWKRDLHRLWSIRLTIAYGVFTGMALVISAFIDVFNPWFLLGISVFVSVATVVLRLVKQADPAE